MDTSCPSLDEQALALLTWLTRTSTTYHLWPAITRRGHLMLLALMSKPPSLAYLASLSKLGRPPHRSYEQMFCS
ncbi:hypothetical protein TIFTF001_046186 [Ficus carica]|uniref:Uncharacterized protein n=1 Tax=Ficus carica TaxID=3494 RepID=A0AA87ZIX3_FICCA|nr:hypothetical protein TIFTF001_046186 [Ficus carica]